MIPAIRISNKLQDFLGFKENYPNYYNFQEIQPPLNE
jgi:hypothetical protein